MLLRGNRAAGSIAMGGAAGACTYSKGEGGGSGDADACLLYTSDAADE